MRFKLKQPRSKPPKVLVHKKELEEDINLRKETALISELRLLFEKINLVIALFNELDLCVISLNFQ